MCTNLPVGNGTHIQGFDTVCTVIIQHPQQNVSAETFHSESVGVDDIIFLTVFLAYNFRGKVLNRQARFHSGVSLLYSKN